MIQRLKIKLRRVGESGMFHDSRADARLLAKCLNETIEKLNEVIDVNNNLNEELKKLKTVPPSQQQE